MRDEEDDDLFFFLFLFLYNSKIIREPSTPNTQVTEKLMQVPKPFLPTASSSRELCLFWKPAFVSTVPI